jgi:hypothetical protein
VGLRRGTQTSTKKIFLAKKTQPKKMFMAKNNGLHSFALRLARQINKHHGQAYAMYGYFIVMLLAKILLV